MVIKTARFGAVEVPEDRVLTIPGGLLGFAGMTRFVLFKPTTSYFGWWMQSCDDTGLALVVTDPSLLFESYPRFESREVLVIMNTIDGRMVANARAPLLIDTRARTMVQVVLREPSWLIRHPFSVQRAVMEAIGGAGTQAIPSLAVGVASEGSR